MGIVFLFYLFLAYNTPLTGDDWTWGTDRGLLRLENKFEDYNGRYVSNILEIILTRFDLIRYFFLAAFSTLLVYTIGKLTSCNHHKISYLLSFIFILLVPSNIFAQTFGWTAGFVNYVPSLALLLIYLILTKNIFNDAKPVYKKWLPLVIVPLGIVTQLIVEHVTLFAVFTAFFVIFYTFYKHKTFYSVHISYLLATIIGAFIMFSNSAYLSVFSGTDSYRTIKDSTTGSSNLLQRIYNTYSDNMYQYLFLENPVINIFISLMVIFLITKAVSKNQWTNYLLKPLLLVPIISFLIYLIAINPLVSDDFFYSKTNDLEALLSITYFISIVFSISFFIKEVKYKTRLLYYICGVVLLTAPFIFVTPYGPRGALASFIFLILIGLELFSYNSRHFNFEKGLLTKPLLITAIVLIVFYTTIFFSNGLVNRDRLNNLDAEVQKEKNTIYVRELPFPEFLWMSSTKRKHFIKMFKRYYEVPESTEVIFVPYPDKKPVNN